MNAIWQKLVSLEDSSLDNLLWNVFWMMKSLTINIDSRQNFKASIFHYVFAILCVTCYMYYYQLGMIYNIGWIFPVTGDVLSVSIIVSLSLASQISTVKIVSVACFRNSIKELVDKYRAFDSTLIPNEHYTLNVLKTLRVVKRRAIIFWCTFCSTSAIYILLPAFLPGQNLPENSLVAIGLQPMSETPNYEITYTISALAGVYATAGIANVTVFLIVVSGYMEANLLALVNEFDFLWENALRYVETINPNPKNKEKHINEYVKKYLSGNIKRHIAIIDFHNIVKGLFNEVIALEFILTTIAMCAMLLGGLEDTYLQIPYTISQLVVDTILGQRLIDSSIAFQKSIYRCGWENFNASNMKTVQLLLQSSQKTLTLTAGNVTYLSYICFTTIVRFVYSVYATLRQAID